MSSPLAIAAVTGVLQYLLNQAYNHPSSVLGNVTVSAVAPDIVQTTVGAGANAALQVNLFLHQVTFNPAWRNMGLPSLSADGATSWTNPPLALDLHYLLTAYAPGDGQAEALLSYALFLLHQNPVLPRDQIRAALAALPPTYSATFATALAACGLADQIELLTIAPATLGREEIAWLWTALKADYRPSYPFRVSVVLIQPTRPITSALPVLQRSISAQPSLLPTFATLSAVNPPNSQPSANLGDTITVQGSNLTGVASVLVTNPALDISQSLTPLPGATGTSFTFTLPNPSLPAPQPTPTDLPAGIYTLSAQVPTGTDTATVTTNSLPLAIAPRIASSWAPTALTSGPSVTVQVPCAPYLRPGQQAFLLIGAQQAAAAPFTTPTNTPSFTFEQLQSTGGQPAPVRLRVDNLDSPIIDMTKAPPVFTGPTLEVN
jgi:hypothetical protein